MVVLRGTNTKIAAAECTDYGSSLPLLVALLSETGMSLLLCGAMARIPHVGAYTISAMNGRRVSGGTLAELARLSGVSNHADFADGSLSFTGSADPQTLALTSGADNLAGGGGGDVFDAIRMRMTWYLQAIA